MGRDERFQPQSVCRLFLHFFFYCCYVTLVSVAAFLSLVFPGSQTRRDKHTETNRRGPLLQSPLIVSLSSLCSPFNLHL